MPLNKIIFFIVIMFSYSHTAYSQINLVKNPSFEDTIQCPTNENQVNYATGWENYSAYSPDYFNSCSFNSDFSVPYNWGGYQLAANGNAYCALGTFAPCSTCPPNIREFIGSQLSTPLAVGTKYFVSFKVCLSISGQIEAYIASNKIGALFTMNSYTWASPPAVNNFAHIYTDSIITDTVNWIRITGSLIADSSYKYIIMGNFFDDLNTDTITFVATAFRFAYYYIDEVCVSTDSIFCANYTTSIKNEDEDRYNFFIYPNPVTDHINIKSSNFNEPFDITIYNYMGDQLYHKNNIINKDSPIDIHYIKSSILFIRLRTQDKFFNYKLLKL